MRDVGIELGSALLIPDLAIVLQPQTALVAIGGPEVILGAALGAMRRQLSTGHRHKWSTRTLDDFQITDNKAIVKCDAAKCLKPIIGIFHELDAYLGDFHGGPSFRFIRPSWAPLRWQRSSTKHSSQSSGAQTTCYTSRVARISADAKIARSTPAELMSYEIEHRHRLAHPLNGRCQLFGSVLQAIEHQLSHRSFSRGGQSGIKALRPFGHLALTVDLCCRQAAGWPDDNHKKSVKSLNRLHDLSATAADCQAPVEKEWNIAPKLGR
jgi:hypothetical protein